MNLNGGSEYHSLIRMAISSDPREELARIQHELLSSLKASHRLFEQKFHFETASSLFAIQIFVVVEVILYFVTPASLDSIQSVFISMAIFAILSGIRIKKSLTFLRWSHFQLQEMDQSAASSEILNGLPFYIRELFTAAYAGTHHMDPVDKTPERILKEIQHQDHRGTVVFIVEICVFVPFIMWMVWVTWAASSFDFQRAFLMIFLLGFIGLFIGIFTLDKKWARSIQQWAGYYAALDRWGNDLEKLISKRKNGVL